MGGSTSGGATGTSGAGGSTDSGGSTGSAGTSGSGGSGGSSGSGGSGGGATGKQFTCPGEPYPEQVKGTETDVCVGFNYTGNWSEGPTWIQSQNAFFFTNFPIGSADGGDIIKVSPEGQCEVWLPNVGCNGMTPSITGNILAACQGPRAVMEYDVVSKQGHVVADMCMGEMLDSPNDLIQRSDGNIYFSNRTAEPGGRPQGLGEGLLRIDPLGAVSVIEMGALNGVGLSPDENLLYVVGKGTWTLDVDGTPLEKGEPTPGGDGFAVDCAGNIIVEGTNSAFGGPEMKTLLVVGPNTAKFIEMTVPGLP